MTTLSLQQPVLPSSMSITPTQCTNNLLSTNLSQKTRWYGRVCKKLPTIRQKIPTLAYGLLFACTTAGAIYSLSRSHIFSAGLCGVASLIVSRFIPKTKLHHVHQQKTPTHILEEILTCITETCIEVDCTLFAIAYQIQRLQHIDEQIDFFLTQKNAPSESLENELQHTIELIPPLVEKIQTLKNHLSRILPLNGRWQRIARTPATILDFLGCRDAQNTPPTHLIFKFIEVAQQLPTCHNDWAHGIQTTIHNFDLFKKHVDQRLENFQKNPTAQIPPHLPHLAQISTQYQKIALILLHTSKMLLK